MGETPEDSRDASDGEGEDDPERLDLDDARDDVEDLERKWGRKERGRPERFVTLKPGESASCQFAIGAWPDGPQFFRFGEPGRHELTATFELHVAKGNPLLAESWQTLGRVEAAAVPFGVVSPDGADRDMRIIRGRVIDAAGAAVPRADVYVHVERQNVGSIDLHREFVADLVLRHRVA